MSFYLFFGRCLFWWNGRLVPAVKHADIIGCGGMGFDGNRLRDSRKGYIEML